MSDDDRYDTNPLDGPAQFAEIIRKLESRIAALEGAPLVGSNLTMVDDHGDVRVRIGRMTAAGGGTGTVYGFEGVTQPGNADWPGGFPFLRVSSDGAEYPYISTAWIDPALFKSVTSGTFADVYQSFNGLIEHKYVSAYIRVATPVGTTGEIRLANVTTSTQSPAVAVPSNTNGYLLVPAWAHGSMLWTGPILFSVQARRLTGSGNVDVYQGGFGLTHLPR